MYVKHLFSAKGQEKQDPFPSQKGQKDHRSRWPHQYNQFLVIWKSLPVPTDGRSPGSQILTYRRLPNFHQWPHLALATYSLLTVTRSHRFCTCFPFNLRPQDLSPAPGASAPAVCLIQLCLYSVTRLITLCQSFRCTSSNLVDRGGLPDVYQAQPPEALRRRASGGFSFGRFWGRSTSGLPG